MVLGLLVEVRESCCAYRLGGSTGHCGGNPYPRLRFLVDGHCGSILGRDAVTVQRLESTSTRTFEQ